MGTREWGFGVGSVLVLARLNLSGCATQCPSRSGPILHLALGFDAVVLHTSKGRLISHLLQRAPFHFREAQRHPSILFSLSPRFLPLAAIMTDL